ncbi:hypothetical protein ACFPYI_09330 [Halomarina salina]|uniref:Uncharacterized protein n=1 Tax=Halomarina salina TaxID=1872699 RepID=A0ABD5RLK7_9EURY|nr:hypothetical protein [Halomarina salina]
MRYGTTVQDGTVYVERPDGDLLVGPYAAVVRSVGGPSWTISYSPWVRERYPDLATDDEGITLDVRDFVESLTLDEAFVESLAACPDWSVNDEDPLSPRLGLFVGRLLQRLERGLE